MLSERLKEATPYKQGCRTCKWLLTLNEKDTQSFNEWIIDKRSRNQLHSICVTDPDNPLKVSLSAFKSHFRDCAK